MAMYWRMIENQSILGIHQNGYPLVNYHSCEVETILHEYWWFTNWKILMFHRYIYRDMLGYWKVYDGHQIGMHWAYQYCGKQTMASWYCGRQHAKKKHQNDSEIVLAIPRGRFIFRWIYYSRFSNENHYKWFIWEYLRLRLQRISIRFITGESTIGGKNLRYPIWIFAPNMVCVNHSCGGWWRTYNGNVNRGVPNCKIPNQLYFCYINVPFFWLKASSYPYDVRCFLGGAMSQPWSPGPTWTCPIIPALDQPTYPWPSSLFFHFKDTSWGIYHGYVTCLISKRLPASSHMQKSSPP